MAATWALVCTMKEPLPVVERFVAHHLALGCHELFLFFSDPEDEAIAWARAQPRVRAEPIEETLHPSPDGTVKRRSRFGEYVTIDEKLLLSAAHANAWAEADWIVHLDADEHVWCPEGVGRYLTELPAEVWQVTLAPFEAVYARFEDSLGNFGSALFRAPLPFGPKSDALVAEFYGPSAPMYRHGLLGPTSGKSFIRRSDDVLQVGIHGGAHRNPEQPSVYERERMKLLHYDALSFERWKRKFLMRVSGEVFSYATGEHRRRQRAAFEAAMEDEAALEALFRELLVLDEGRLRFALDHGMVERLDPRPPGNG